MNRDAAAVVLPSGHHGDLGIARSLGRLGVPVYIAGAAWWEPVSRSRYCRGRLRCDWDRGASSRAIDQLLEAGRKLPGPPLLVPTTDRQVVWVADNAGALSEVFRFPRQDAGLVRTLCDKSLMRILAGRCGVPTPQATVPGSIEDVEDFAESAAFPVMVKATEVESMRRRVGGTKFVIHDARELIDLCRRAEDPEGPNLMIQEFIPGDDWMFDGYFDRDSVCRFGLSGCKIRRFPVYTGVTSLGICVRNEELEQLTARFMQQLGYRGILDIGYRRDRRDGQYKVLDVNPRIGCTFRLFTDRGGLDVARVLYLDLTSQAVSASEPSEGRKWVVEDFDLLSSIRLWREGALRLKDWADSFRGVQEYACFAADDPMPCFWMGLSDLRAFREWIGRPAVRTRAQDDTNLAVGREVVP
jgi:D-aspartate ligase